MLLGERYTSSNTHCNKNFSKVVEIGKEPSKLSDVLGGDSVLMNNVATAYKGRETLDKFTQNMAMDRCNVDL
jgi:hypothetical protein